MSGLEDSQTMTQSEKHRANRSRRSARSRGALRSASEAWHVGGFTRLWALRNNMSYKAERFLDLHCAVVKPIMIVPVILASAQKRKAIRRKICIEKWNKGKDRRLGRTKGRQDALMKASATRRLGTTRANATNSHRLGRCLSVCREGK